MRILAIRGANIASLEGPFALELDRSPLAESGVFAICGPTGAGKSTLLDTMCLALFDTAPRVAVTARTRVGREDTPEAERLTASDPRSLLRKGAGSGFAEVDFRAVDGRRLRARWEVRRARERADGRLQAQAMTLFDLGAERYVGHTKTEVKAAIESALGLTFDQFRRSVLLAQGDFAAFLQAEGRDRAELLERMTGTEVYSRISAEAYARAQRERQAVALLATRAEATPVMSAEDRAELEGRRPALERSLAETELARSNARRALRWYDILSGLREEVAEAEGEVKRVDQQLALAETRRAELTKVDAAGPLREPLAALDRAAAELLAATAGQAEAEAAAKSAEAQAKAARSRLAEGVRARAKAEESAEASRGPLERARALDRDLARELSSLAEAAQKAQAAQAAQREAEAKAVELRAVRATRANETKAAEAALSSLAGHRALGRGFAGFGPVLAEVEAATGERAAAAAARVEAERRQAATAAEAEARAGAHREALASVAAKADAHRAARAKALSAPSEGLVEARKHWVALRSAYDTLVGVAGQAQSAHDAALRHREAAAAHGEQASEAAQAAVDGRAARGPLEGRLAEAERSLGALRSSLDLTARRAELVEGEPCPLCGAEDHPYADGSAPLASAAEEQASRVTALRAEVQRVDEVVAAAVSAEAGARRAEAEASREAESWEAALEVQRARWVEVASEVRTGDQAWPAELPRAAATSAAEPEPAGPDWGPLFRLTEVEVETAPQGGALLGAEARRGLEEARTDARDRIAALEREESARRVAERQAESARQALDEARVEAERARVARAEAEASREKATREVEAAAGAMQRAEAAAARGLAVLAEPLAAVDGWRAGREEDPAAWAEALRAKARSVVSHEASLVAARDALAELAPALERAEGQAQHRRQAAEAIAAQRARHEAAAAELASSRSALFEGRDAAEVEAELRAALVSSRSAEEEARGLLQRAEAAAVSAETGAGHGRRRTRDAEAARAAAGQGLSAALSTVAIDEAEARRRLAHDPAEVESWRRELAALDRERAEARAVLAERSRRRAAHEEDDPPPAAKLEVEAQLTEASTRAEALSERLAQLRARLAQDDTHRERRGVLEAELAAAQEGLGVWETLASLIGSASGSKLQAFAQSLTLELLLEHANRHLRDLAPRYALEKAPGSDLALQVIDREMGDEVRGVRSLSGGESFLVALGLALGLASLSSERSKVDSLFIDEGFGSLDPGSLEVVLGTLDALQATGRQVGLISHVQAVAERFETRVQVEAAGPARSRVHLLTAGGLA